MGRVISAVLVSSLLFLLPAVLLLPGASAAIKRLKNNGKGRSEHPSFSAYGFRSAPVSKGATDQDRGNNLHQKRLPLSTKTVNHQIHRRHLKSSHAWDLLPQYNELRYGNHLGNDRQQISNGHDSHTEVEFSDNGLLDSLGGEASFQKRLDTLGGGELFKKSFESLAVAEHLQVKKRFDSLGGGELSSFKKRLDTLGGGELPSFKKRLDSLGGGDLSPFKKRLDSLGGGDLSSFKKRLDSLGGGDLSSFKKRLDSLGGGELSAFKKSFDSLGGGELASLKKRFNSLGGELLSMKRREESNAGTERKLAMLQNDLSSYDDKQMQQVYRRRLDIDSNGEIGLHDLNNAFRGGEPKSLNQHPRQPTFKVSLNSQSLPNEA